MKFDFQLNKYMDIKNKKKENVRYMGFMWDD